MRNGQPETRAQRHYTMLNRDPQLDWAWSVIGMTRGTHCPAYAFSPHRASDTHLMRHRHWTEHPEIPHMTGTSKPFASPPSRGLTTCLLQTHMRPTSTNFQRAKGRLTLTAFVDRAVPRHVFFLRALFLISTLRHTREKNMLFDFCPAQRGHMRYPCKANQKTRSEHWRDSKCKKCLA